MKEIILIIIFSLVEIICTYGQHPIGNITYSKNSRPMFIEFDERLPKSNNSQAVLQANLSLDQDDQFILKQQIIDRIGRLHQKYQQFYKGIKVESGVYTNLISKHAIKVI